SYPSTGCPAEDVQCAGNRRAGCTGEIRLSSGCLPFWGTSPWGDRLRIRSAGDAAPEITEHPRSHCLSQKSACPGSDGRRTLCGGSDTAERFGDPDAGDLVRITLLIRIQGSVHC